MSILNLIFGWDETRPRGTDLMSTVDDWIREFKITMRQIIGVDHIMDSSGPYDHFGKHRKLTMRMFIEGTDDMPVPDDGSLVIYAREKNDPDKTKILSILYPDASEDALAWQSDMTTAKADIDNLKENKFNWISKPPNTDFNTLLTPGKYRVSVAPGHNANQPGGTLTHVSNWTIEVDNDLAGQDVCVQTVRAQHLHQKTWRRRTSAVVSGTYTWGDWVLCGGTFQDLRQDYTPIVISEPVVIHNADFNGEKVITVGQIPNDGLTYECVLFWEFSDPVSGGGNARIGSTIQALTPCVGGIIHVKTNNRQLRLFRNDSSSARAKITLYAINAVS